MEARETYAARLATLHNQSAVVLYQVGLSPTTVPLLLRTFPTVANVRVISSHPYLAGHPRLLFMHNHTMHSNKLRKIGKVTIQLRSQTYSGFLHIVVRPYRPSSVEVSVTCKRELLAGLELKWGQTHARLPKSFRGHRWSLNWNLDRSNAMYRLFHFASVSPLRSETSRASAGFLITHYSLDKHDGECIFSAAVVI